MKLECNIMRIGLPVLLILALASCQSAPEAGADRVSARPATSVRPPDPPIAAFAQAACGGCHAVRPDSLSPNPASPAFAEIANRPGLTEASMATWLRDAHNYPEDMDFELDGKQVDALAAYILSLRVPDYRAPIS